MASVDGRLPSGSVVTVTGLAIPYCVTPAKAGVQI